MLWVLNTPLNTIATFFLDVSKLKLMTFSIFFQRLTFPPNTCQRIRCIQNPVKHSSTMLKLCRDIYIYIYIYIYKLYIYIFCKIHKKKPVMKSHFNKVSGLYNVTSLKKRTPTQVFSSDFCKLIKTPFLQNACRRLLLFYGKNILSIKQQRTL